MAIFTRNPSSGNGANGYYLNIEDYYDKIHRTTWARRTAGLLAGATLGAIYGAIGGALAAFVPYALGAIGIAGATAIPFSTALAAIPASVALFAGITATLGMAITADVAANAASSAVGLEEKERREKLAQQMNGECAGPNCPPPPALEPPHKITPSEKGPPLFNWKTAIVTIPLFAAFGALIACHPFTSSVVFGHEPFTSLAGGTAAAVAASSSVFGLFGAFLGLKSSLFTNQLANFYYKVVTGQLFEKEPQQQVALEVQPQVTVEKSPENVIDEPSRPTKSFAAEKARFSLQQLIEKTEKPCPEQPVMVTR